MLDARINTVNVWYSNVIGERVEVTDENGDYTGEYARRYSKPEKKRLNISPAHGSAEDAVFGLSVSYTKIITTANMNLPFTLHTIIWDEDPGITDDFVAGEGDNVFATQSVYKIVRVAKGRYHARYALKQLHEDEADDEL